LGLSYVPWEWG